MSYNGSGVYTLYSTGNPVVTGTVISSTWANNTLADIATALNLAVLKDGQQTITANIPMATYKFTGVGAGTAATDTATLANILAGTGIYAATVGGTADAITLTPSPAITAYAAGQRWCWIASGANTTNVTVAISGLAARALTKNGATALLAGDIPSGAIVFAVDDGTRLQVVGLIGNLASLKTAQTWTAVQTFTNSDIKLLGSSTGATTFTSDNAGATNYTMHVPAADDTLAAIAATQEFTNKTYSSGTLKGTYSASGTVTIPAITLGGAVTGNGQNISGLGTIGSGAITSTGILSTTDATDATSTTAASLKTAGGLAVAKKAYFGDAITEIPRAASYNWDSWVPSDVAGTLTSAASTGSAVTATAYVTMANSSGTVTFTFVKAGKYLVSLNTANQPAAAYTELRSSVTLGGTVAINAPSALATAYGVVANLDAAVRTATFLITATANQTLTILPKISATQGGGTAANYTGTAHTEVLYVGT